MTKQEHLPPTNPSTEVCHVYDGVPPIVSLSLLLSAITSSHGPINHYGWPINAKSIFLIKEIFFPGFFRASLSSLKSFIQMRQMQHVNKVHYGMLSRKIDKKNPFHDNNRVCYYSTIVFCWFRHAVICGGVTSQPDSVIWPFCTRLPPPFVTQY